MQLLLKGGEANCCFTSVTLRREKKNKVTQNRHAALLIVACFFCPFFKKKKLSSLCPFLSLLSSAVGCLPPLPASRFHMTGPAALQPIPIVSLTLPPFCSALSPPTFRQPPRAILLRMFLPAVFSSSSLCFELLTPSTASLLLL